MACSLFNDYGSIDHVVDIDACDPALPNPETFYPAKVCWTTYPSTGYLPASDCNIEPVAMSRPKTPSESKIRRQEMFRSGRLAAYAALQKAGFDDPISDAHRIKVVGKNPDRSPCWPTGFVGSISHSDRWVTAAAARWSDYQSIGIDSEILVAEPLAKELQPDIGTPSEWKLLDDAGIKLTSAFTLLFSAKEAFYKCWYPLKRRFMEHLDVAAYGIKRDRCIADSNANYGVIFMQPQVGHIYGDKSEADAMQLAIRYCITSQDVFTIAVLKSERRFGLSQPEASAWS